MKLLKNRKIFVQTLLKYLLAIHLVNKLLRYLKNWISKIACFKLAIEIFQLDNLVQIEKLNKIKI